jgi:hypothetical protein
MNFLIRTERGDWYHGTPLTSHVYGPDTTCLSTKGMLVQAITEYDGHIANLHENRRLMIRDAINDTS